MFLLFVHLNEVHIGEVPDVCNWIQFGRDKVKIENTRNFNLNNVDRGSDCEVFQA